MLEEETPAPCPLCERPNYHPSDHHLVPKSRGGRRTRTLCQDCHSAIHALFSNKELADTYCTVEALASEPRLARMVAFLRKQDPTRRTRTARPRSRRRR